MAKEQEVVLSHIDKYNFMAIAPPIQFFRKIQVAFFDFLFTVFQQPTLIHK